MISPSRAGFVITGSLQDSTWTITRQYCEFIPEEKNAKPGLIVDRNTSGQDGKMFHYLISVRA